MSYRHSWSKQFYPDEYYTEGKIGWAHPIVCPDHKDEEGRSICFKIGGSTIFGAAFIGTWYLNTPRVVAILMPGTKPKILTATCKALAKPGGLGSWWHDVHNILILQSGDRTEYWRSGELYVPENQWGLNKLEINKSLSPSDTLQLSLYQELHIELGAWEGHVAETILDGEYYTEEPPATASVRVTVKDTKTGKTVGKAYVALMSGTRVVADGYTNGGEVTFPNVDEGSYTLKILAGGYYDFDMSVSVVVPSVWYVAKIVPIPVPPTPDWVKYAGYAAVGLGALGAVMIVPKLIRKEKPEYVVVR